MGHPFSAWALVVLGHPYAFRKLVRGRGLGFPFSYKGSWQKSPGAKAPFELTEIHRAKARCFYPKPLMNISQNTKARHCWRAFFSLYLV
jgi:hypothetical protein